MSRASLCVSVSLNADRRYGLLPRGNFSTFGSICTTDIDMAYDTGTTHYYSSLFIGSFYFTHLNLAWGLLLVTPYSTSFREMVAVWHFSDDAGVPCSPRPLHLLLSIFPTF